MKWPFRRRRPPESTAPAAPTASADIGLIAWLEDTRIALPLKAVECRFEVTGGVARVELDQVFHFNARKPLDCTYLFPLPDGAAVDRCTLHVNDRSLEARIEPLETARDQAARHHADGRRVALVTAERPNLFSLALGNMQPDDLVVVRLAWMQAVDRTGPSRRLLIPSCPGVRYIPGRPLVRTPSGNGLEADTDEVPDASRLSPPRIDSLHPDAAFFSLSGHLSPEDADPTSVSSPTHPLRVSATPTSDGAATAAATAAATEATHASHPATAPHPATATTATTTDTTDTTDPAVATATATDPAAATDPTHVPPDAPTAMLPPVAVSLAHAASVPDRDFVLVWHEPAARTLAPSSWQWSHGGTTYALVQLRAPQPDASHPPQPRDYYFLVDTSGSMEGAKWSGTCRALHALVAPLMADDRVWITLFASDWVDFAEAPRPAPAVFADAGFQRLGDRPVDGGTELLPAARHVLDQIDRHSPGRPVSVILITDGEVANEQAVLNLFRKAPDVRLHTFGVDTTVNDAFLRALARQQRGTCCLLTPDDDIAGTIATIGGRLRHPVVTELGLEAPWEAADDTWPDLHAGEVVSLAVCSTRPAPPPPVITGVDAAGRRHTLIVPPPSPGSEAVRLLFARQRITALVAANRIQEAIAVACTHSLLSRHTAFVVWDTAQMVPVAQATIVQPSMTPHQPRAICFYSRAPGPPKPPDAADQVSDPPADYDPSSLQRRSPSAPDTPPDPLTREHAAARADQIAEIHAAVQALDLPDAVIGAWVVAIVNAPPASPSQPQRLHRAIGQMLELRARTHSPALRHALEHAFARSISPDPERFFDWLWHFADAFRSLLDTCQALVTAATPPPVADAVCAWAVDGVRVDHDRQRSLALLASGLLKAAASPADQRRVWEAFIDGSLARPGAACPRVSHWFATAFSPPPAGRPT